MSDLTLHLGELWHTPIQPAPGRAEAALVAVPKGALAVDADGRIAALGTAVALRRQYPKALVVDWGAALILPGFVDAHVHFPQLDMIGAYGEQLFRWLEAYTYPTEERFADAAFAAATAERFLTELLANGTTLAAVFSSVHEAAAEALFAAGERRGLRLIVGKASMDREAPASLLQPAAADLAANERLIRTWHGRAGRLHVALTPRFAVSCSPALLAGLGELRRRHPTVFVQSHHAETTAEVETVRRLFPEAAHYLGVYEHFGLLGQRTIMGHGIHVVEDELSLYQASGTSCAHCPTSNLFLGSGVFPLNRYEARDIPVGLGTDVGAGTSLSLLATMAEAYKVQHLRGIAVSPVHLLYLATLGGARALGLDGITGCLSPGKRADFQVLDWRRSRLLAARFAAEVPAFDRLFALAFLGDDRLTQAVYVDGRRVFES